MYDEMCLDTFLAQEEAISGNLAESEGKRRRNFFRTVSQRSVRI